MNHACDKMQNMESVKITGGLVPDKTSDHYRMAWYLNFDELWSGIDYCPWCGTHLTQGRIDVLRK